MLDISSARVLLAGTRPAHVPDGYPPEVRSQVTQLARHLVDGGRTAASVAHELGVHRTTLSSWLASSTSLPGSFVPVVVDEQPDSHVLAAASPADSTPVVAPAHAPSPRPSLTLVTPRGCRLEGLDLDDAIAALGRLG